MHKQAIRPEAAFKELPERRKWFDDFLYLLPAAVFEVDVLNPSITYINRQALLLFGYSEADFMTGIAIAQLFAEGEYERAAQLVNGCIEKHRTHQSAQDRDGVQEIHEFLLRRKDGSFFHGEMQTSFVWGDDHCPIRLRTIIHDIKEHQRLANKLQKSETKYQALFKALPDLMFLLSHDGIYLDYFASAAHLLFVPPEQFLGHHVREVMPPEIAEACLRGVQQVQRTGKLQILEYSLLIRGETHYFEARLIPYEANQIIFIVREVTEQQRAVLGLRQVQQELEQKVAARTAELRATNESLKNEITERARVETELRHSEERYHALYEDNPSMYFTVDPGGKVFSVNRFGAEQLGYTAQELIGQSVLQVFCLDDQKRVLQQLAECAQHLGRVFQWELRKVRKDGSLMWVKEDARAVRDNDGHTIILIVCEDISACKDAEAALRESEKLAAAGQMAARIAHEINNPLAGIQNSLRLVGRAVPQEHRYYHYLDKIDHEIERIAQFIRLMLDLHKPNKPSNHHFQVDECIQEVIALMKLEAQKRNVEIAGETKGAAVMVDFPENHLRQILYNLIQNAIDASPQDSLVYVTAAVNQQQLIIIVKDQGSGIPDEVRPHIFETYFTTKSGSTPGGIGLGLPVCKNLVEARQGSIECDSKLGQGTTFRVTLPLDSSVL